MNAELHTLTIAELAPLLRQRKLSPVELARALLARIDALDGQLNAFITLTAERALADARRAEAEITAGRWRGPLHGIPFALKDIIDTAGIRTTAHSKVLADNVPRVDAAVVTRLAAAGAVLMGKLATHEFAHGGPSFDLPWPVPRNPWNLEHFVGGSSSGSAAAVAAGLVPASLGSDTGGSIRGPAALAGIAGFKPTYGLVSRRGVIPNAWSFDHVGPLARSIEDCAILLQAIAGHDPDDPASAAGTPPDYRAALSTDLDGLRIGVLRHFWEEDVRVEPCVATAMDEALRTLAARGARVAPARLRPVREYTDVRNLIAEVELFSVHQDALINRPQDFGADLLRKVLPACLFQAGDYVQAQRQRRRLLAEFDALYRDFDLLVAPGLGPAPRLDAVDNRDFWQRPNLLYPFSVGGGPVASVCIGFSPQGLPLGMQIAGAPFNDALVLRAGHAYEGATGWRQRHPPLIAGAVAPPVTPRPALSGNDLARDPALSVLAERAGLRLGAREEALLQDAAPGALAVAARIRRDHAYDVEPAALFHAVHGPSTTPP